MLIAEIWKQTHTEKSAHCLPRKESQCHICLIVTQCVLTSRVMHTHVHRITCVHLQYQRCGAASFLSDSRGSPWVPSAGSPGSRPEAPPSPTVHEGLAQSQASQSGFQTPGGDQAPSVPCHLLLGGTRRRCRKLFASTVTSSQAWTLVTAFRSPALWVGILPSSIFPEAPAQAWRLPPRGLCDLATRTPRTDPALRTRGSRRPQAPAGPPSALFVFRAFGIFSRQ